MKIIIILISNYIHDVHNDRGREKKIKNWIFTMMLKIITVLNRTFLLYYIQGRFVQSKSSEQEALDECFAKHLRISKIVHDKNSIKQS